MDDDTRSKAQERLKRIAGQVIGTQRMVEADRHRVDILHQVAATQAALMKTGRVVLAGHVENRLSEAIRRHDERERREKVNELVDLLSRLCRLDDLTAQAEGVPSTPQAKCKGLAP